MPEVEVKSPEIEDKTEEEVKSPMIEEAMEVPSENVEIETLETEDKVEEVKKKLLDATKEKALLKLEKDKLQKKAFVL